jgi:biotin transporter BioY
MTFACHVVLNVFFDENVDSFIQVVLAQASCLLGRHSTTRVTSPAFFFTYLVGQSFMFLLGWLWIEISLPMPPV